MFHRTSRNVVLLLVLLTSIWTRSSLCVKELSSQENESNIHEKVKVVEQCPYTKNGWIKAAEQKNCTGYYSNQPSKPYVYHCVINEWANATLEVCAVKILVIFGKCPEYNIGARRILSSDIRSCNISHPSCPSVYNSTDAYKYKSCYNLSTDWENKQNRYSESKSTQPLSILQNNPVEDSSESWEMILPLSIGVVVCIVLVISLVFVIYRRGKTYSGSQPGDSEEGSTLVNDVHNSSLK